MSIFYEQVDLLERALDVFLNEERTSGIFPRFEFGGAIGGGVGLTAFHIVKIIKIVHLSNKKMCDLFGKKLTIILSAS